MLSSKKHERIEKALGTEVLVDLEALSLEDLKSRIAQADGYIKSTQD